MQTFNTFIIGAQKSATTWLADRLNQEDFIEVPWYKESHYFCDKRFCAKAGRFDITNYEVQKNSPSFLVDVCVDYSFDISSLDRVLDYCPNAKIIFILRHPTDRMASALNMINSKNNFKDNPLQLLTEHPEVVERSYYLKTCRFLAHHVPNDSVLVLDYSWIESKDPRIEILLSEFFNRKLVIDFRKLAQTPVARRGFGFLITWIGCLGKRKSLLWFYYIANLPVIKRLLKKMFLQNNKPKNWATANMIEDFLSPDILNRLNKNYAESRRYLSK